MPFDAFNQGTTVTKPKTWTLDLGLELVRAMQPLIKPMNYHVMIAGGVLQNGKSNRDLDLVFMPIMDGVTNDIELLTWLGETFGRGTISRSVTPKSVYKHFMQFKYDGLLIDTFIG